MRCAALLDPCAALTMRCAALLDPCPALAMRRPASLIRLDVSLRDRPALPLRPGDIGCDRPALIDQRWDGERDRYRGMPHRHCILMHPQDAGHMGWCEHQRVSVRGDAGQLDQIEIIFGDVRSGSALMFYSEANVLMKAHIEPRSGTPAYKRVPVVVWVSEE